MAKVLQSSIVALGLWTNAWLSLVDNVRMLISPVTKSMGNPPELQLETRVSQRFPWKALKSRREGQKLQLTI